MKKLLVICGATASGKSALAVKCAKRLGGEIISCDALLVYKGLNIGTAKPTKEEMGNVPHYMIDVAEPSQKFSVSDFERMALPILEDVLSRDKVPVLCGGTGFYINALLYKSSFGSTPENGEIRERYEAIAREKGNAYLHALLKEVDEESAAVLHENDVKRVIRALEIFYTTGHKKSEQRDEKKARYPFLSFAFNFPREELYGRIERRVDEMLQNGLVEEVKGLLEKVGENAQCMQGIGYKEVLDCLKNNDLQSTMSDIIKKNTRNYAKRQLTFFKRMENLHWLAAQSVESAAEEVIGIYEGR